MKNLIRYITTVETAKHRIFQFLGGEILPDNMIVVIATSDAYHLEVLSSHIHVNWALMQGGTLEDRPRYNKSVCFDPFPFPDADASMKERIAELAEAIDKHRKDVQAAHPEITLTQTYNVLEKVKGASREALSDPHPNPPHKGEGVNSASPSPLWGGIKGGGRSVFELSNDERRIFNDALILILRERHEELDVAVAAAYGWPADLSDDEILGRLVALNRTRAAEEARGLVRWLRPDYQIPRFGTARDKQVQIEADLGMAPVAKVKPTFPVGAVEQTAAVMAALAMANTSVTADELAQGFKQGKKAELRIAATLSSLARTGFISVETGGKKFSLRRAA